MSLFNTLGVQYCEQWMNGTKQHNRMAATLKCRDALDQWSNPGSGE